MRTVSYDSLTLNSGILLDLPQREGTGTVLHDVSKGHRNVTLVHAPVWTPDGSIMSLVYDGSGDYAWATNANTTDLEFTSGDYSIGCWVNWEDISISEMVMGRYELNVGGWELYLTRTGIDSLTLRHHHAGTLVGGVARSGCYSVGWTPHSGWCLLGVSRTGGGEAQMYRNGVPLAMTTGGLVDPETTTSNLIIGARYDHTTNWFKGGMYRPRIWGRIITTDEWLGLYNAEVGLFA